MRVAAPVLTRLLAALLAIALVAAGALTVVEVVANVFDGGFAVLPTDSPDRLRTTQWDDPVVMAVAVGSAAVGLLLLLAALWPRPPLTLEADVDGVRVERHALERSLRRRLGRVDGVSGAQVRVNRRRVRARVDTNRRLRAETVGTDAERELRDACERLGLRLRTDVRLRKRDGNES